MRRLVGELEARYGEQHAYAVLERVFDEHFALAADQEGGSEQVRVKTGDELSASSLQSPDDWEATYRVKRGEGHQGYVANLTETCDPENEVQLITQVQVAPNITDDQQFVVEGLSDLKARTDLESLWTDGGYNGSDAEETFQQEQVEHIPTNIRGRRTAPDRLGLETFSWEIDENGTPLTVKCPGGQQAEVKTGRKADRFVAHFEQAGCETCAFRRRVPGSSCETSWWAVVEREPSSGASRAVASAGCPNTRSGQQLASSDREHRPQCDASVRRASRQVACSWSGSSDASVDLLGSDGQFASDLAS